MVVAGTLPAVTTKEWPEAVERVSSYLREARGAGFTEVRLIHGKGTGTRRAEVRRLLEKRTDVADFSDAPPERGGFGATVVRFAAPAGGAGAEER